MNQVSYNKSMKRQSGFVAILVTMILMVITSLIVLSFAFLARQNQTRNLNSQLSTQAFYAAESGVNVAAGQLRAGTLSDITNCAGTNQLGSQQVGDDDTVKFTCVLVDQAPTNLKYDPISTEKSTVVHIKTNGTPTNMLVSWQSASPQTHIFMASSNFALPQEKSDNKMIQDGGTGILRTTIIPTSAISGSDQAGSLLDASRTYFLYPNQSLGSDPGTITNTSTDGLFGLGNCSTLASPRECNTKISLTTNDFYLRLKAIYSSVNVTIQLLDGSGQPQAITGAQAVIDATGKAQNVVRRIQVRMPLMPVYSFPEFALETTDTICKRFAVYPGGATIINPKSSLYSPSHSIIPNDPDGDATACQLPGSVKPNFH